MTIITGKHGSMYFMPEGHGRHGFPLVDDLLLKGCHLCMAFGAVCRGESLFAVMAGTAGSTLIHFSHTFDLLLFMLLEDAARPLLRRPDCGPGYVCGTGNQFLRLYGALYPCPLSYGYCHLLGYPWFYWLFGIGKILGREKL